VVDSAFERDTNNYILTTVKEGMDVYDWEGKKIGTVSDVYMGESSPQANERGEGAVTPSNRDTGGDTLIENVARVFAGDELPEVLRGRLLRSGFIRMNTGGLFSKALYILPDQIDQVAGPRIDLRVMRDQLISRDSAVEP